MRDAGILQDDYVVVRPCRRRRRTATSSALLGEDATVKRYFKEKDHIRLQPENETMEPIRVLTPAYGKVVGGLQKDPLMSQLLDKSEVRSGGRDHERLFDTGDRRTLDDAVTRLSQPHRSWERGLPRLRRQLHPRGRGKASATGECPDCGSTFE